MEDDEYEKMMRSIRFKRVTEVFKKDQKDWSKHLEELGFTWVDRNNQHLSINRNSTFKSWSAGRLWCPEITSASIVPS
jgi:hypothetical protein